MRAQVTGLRRIRGMGATTMAGGTSVMAPVAGSYRIREMGAAIVAGVAWAIALAGPASPVAAHQIDFSHVELRVADDGIDGVIEAPAAALDGDLSLERVRPGGDLSRERGQPGGDRSLEQDRPGGRPGTRAAGENDEDARFRLLTSRFVVVADGETLAPTRVGREARADSQKIRVRLRYSTHGLPAALIVRCRLFPNNPLHKTFLDLYQDGRLVRQAIFDAQVTEMEHQMGSRQSIGAVARRFLVEGVRHIFNGPDHILFVIGLLLCGGGIRQLLKIVSAFTVAHSITLALATLNVLNPPSRVIEPAIAASIVFVGVHSLLNRSDRDPRLLLAFGFGFIHGFGFANALREMELPRSALVLSLLAFNGGVELGQACIVGIAAPVLSVLRARARPVVARQVLRFASVGVILAGALWFIQRVVARG